MWNGWNLTFKNQDKITPLATVNLSPFNSSPINSLYNINTFDSIKPITSYPVDDYFLNTSQISTLSINDLINSVNSNTITYNTPRI